MAQPRSELVAAENDVPRWQLQEAKQRFSELARRAQDEGAQLVTKHGEDFLAIVPIEDYREYRRLKGAKLPFNEFLMAGPYLDVDIEIPRSKEPVRIPDFASEDEE